EGALGGEGAHVQLIDHRTACVQAGPAGVGELEASGVEASGGSVYIVRLPRTARIGQGSTAIEHERVVLAVFERAAGVPPVAVAVHRLPAAGQLDLHPG